MPHLSRLSLPAYAVCLWLILFPFVDATLLAMPLSPSMEAWRYSMALHTTLYMLSPMMGVFLALVLAVVFEQARVLKAVEVFSGLALLGLLTLVVVYFVDSFGLRGEERPGLVPAFGLRWAVILFKLVVAMVVAVTFMLAARGLARGEGTSDKAAPGGLVR